MPIKIKSTGGGSVSIDVPATGTDYVLYAPGNNANIFTDTGGTISGSVQLGVTPFYGSSPNVTSDFTVSNTYNQLSVGPVAVANGVTVTVANNAYWTVV